MVLDLDLDAMTLSKEMAIALSVIHWRICLHSSRSENGEISDKKAQKKKKKQSCLDHERARRDSGSTPAANVNAYNVSSGVCKDLSQIKYFNCNKKGHYSRNCPEPRMSKR